MNVHIKVLCIYPYCLLSFLWSQYITSDEHVSKKEATSENICKNSNNLYFAKSSFNSIARLLNVKLHK